MLALKQLLKEGRVLDPIFFYCMEVVYNLYTSYLKLPWLKPMGFLGTV